jgi:hypothetical protein
MFRFMQPILKRTAEGFDCPVEARTSLRPFQGRLVPDAVTRGSLRSPLAFICRRVATSILASRLNSIPPFNQSPSSNRTMGASASPVGGGGNFVILRPASRIESSTTSFPEPCIIENSLTVPSRSIFNCTVAANFVPRLISLRGWFQAASNRLRMIWA